MKIHLVLKSKWFDMILSGEKTEEYRSFVQYWIVRIWKHRDVITSVVFHRGYTDTTHERECIGISKGIGKKDWGAPENEVIILKLGKEISKKK